MDELIGSASPLYQSEWRPGTLIGQDTSCCKDTGIQGYRIEVYRDKGIQDKGIQGYRDTGIHICRDTVKKRYRDTETGIQKYKDTELLENKGIGIQS